MSAKRLVRRARGRRRSAAPGADGRTDTRVQSLVFQQVVTERSPGARKSPGANAMLSAKRIGRGAWIEGRRGLRPAVGPRVNLTDSEILARNPRLHCSAKHTGTRGGCALRSPDRSCVARTKTRVEGSGVRAARFGPPRDVRRRRGNVRADSRRLGGSRPQRFLLMPFRRSGP